MLEVAVGGREGRRRGVLLLCIKFYCIHAQSPKLKTFMRVLVCNYARQVAILLPPPSSYSSSPPPLCRVACSPFGTSNWPDSCSQINVSRWQLPPGSTTVYDSFARTTVAALKQQQGAWPRGWELVLGLVKVLCCAPDALCR